MSVQDQIDRITQGVANTYAVLQGLGAELPDEQTSDNLAATAGTAKAVLYSDQTLTEAQKEQARENIGVDAYLTEELAKRGQLKPEFANSIEECTDTSKLYVLPDGYIYCYLPTLIPGSPSYTNRATTVTDGYRLNSSGSLTSNSGTAVVEDYIPFTVGTVVRVKGLKLGSTNVAFYDSSKNILASGAHTYPGANGSDTITWEKETDEIYKYTNVNNACAYVRFGGILTGSTDDVIITVNEEIKESEPTTGHQWANTGHAFVPADYEERIIQAENNIADHSARIAALEEKAENSDTVIDLPDYWLTEIETKSNVVKDIQQAGGIKCVSFAYAGDTHIPDCDTGKTQRLGKVMAGMLDTCNIPFSVICGDVGTRASYQTEADFVATHAQFPIHLSPLWGTDRLLLAMGNHDGCYGDSSGYYRKQFSPERMWQTYYREHSLDFKKVFSNDGLYYYIDNVSQKTRFIVLNSNFAGPYSVDANGWATNDRFSKSCYGQAQLDWLANEALIMPDGYSAILFTHVPPNITYTTDKQQLIGIVNAFCNKTSFSGKYTGGVNGWDNSSVNVNFASAKGTLVGMFTGHVHGDSVDTTTMACPIITILAAGAGANDPYKETEPTRKANTATETNFDVVTVNLSTRTIYLTRVGAGDNRQVTY